MPDPTRAHCQSCGQSRHEVGPISWGGNCASCGEEAELENHRGLKTKSGPAFRYWKRKALEGLAALDTGSPSGHSPS